MQIVINVPEWAEENARLEEDAGNLDELLALAVDDNWPSSQIVRAYIVQRELGLAEEDLLPENKRLLQSGGVLAINGLFSSLRKAIETNGKCYQVRKVVGDVSDEPKPEEGQPAREDQTGRVFEAEAESHPWSENQPAHTQRWHALGTPGALDSAVNFIQRRIVGYITGRLLVVRESGGDVAKEADWLIEKIEEIKGDLVEAEPTT